MSRGAVRIDCQECSEIHSVDDVNDFAAVLDCMSPVDEIKGDL